MCISVLTAAVITIAIFELQESDRARYSYLSSDSISQLATQYGSSDEFSDPLIMRCDSNDGYSCFIIADDSEVAIEEDLSEQIINELAGSSIEDIQGNEITWACDIDNGFDSRRCEKIDKFILSQ
jgi:hypothetical protein